MSDGRLTLDVPPELLDAIAEEVAERLAARNGDAPASGYLDADAAASYLACPRSRIYELATSGRLAHYRDGRRLLFSRADLDAALRRSNGPT